MSSTPAPLLPEGLQRDWAFQPSVTARPAVSLHERKEAVLKLRPAPAHKVLKQLTRQARWSVYFMFLPQGRLTDSHRFTLARLRAMGRALMVVCATPGPDSVPAELASQCDALYWKALSGYDFSAYRLALHAIAGHAPHADVFVMNDSVYGPLTDLTPWVDQPPWELTGFTASSQIENHVQSYAFVMKDVTPSRLRRLWSVLPPLVAFSRPFDVIEYQETRLAKVASRAMSVGAYWYADAARIKDPTLVCPLQMVEAGFPFLKKSLLGKHAGFADQEAVLALLRACGHPAPEQIQAGGAAVTPLAAR